MKIRTILETNPLNLPMYQDPIKDFNDWIKIKNSGKYKPDSYNNNFKCDSEGLTSLEGSPIEVRGTFQCEENLLTTLIGGPRKVLGGYDCSFNKLTSLEGIPEYIGSVLYATGNQITSLKNIHKQILGLGGGLMFVNENPITSNILGVLLIKNISAVRGTQEVFDIIDKHLRGDRDVLECQEEMISAGYKEFAKL